MSPASGDALNCTTDGRRREGVSIQLMSPASGDEKKKNKRDANDFCFHSINVPSEWGQIGDSLIFLDISFPFN